MTHLNSITELRKMLLLVLTTSKTESFGGKFCIFNEIVPLQLTIHIYTHSKKYLLKCHLGIAKTGLELLKMWSRIVVKWAKTELAFSTVLLRDAPRNHGVLVQAAIIKIPWTEGLKQQTFISHSPEPGISKIKMPTDSVSDEEPPSWFAASHLLAVASQGREAGVRETSCLFLLLQEDEHHVWGLHSHDPLTSQRPHLQTPSHWEFVCNICIQGRDDMNIQFIAHWDDIQVLMRDSSGPDTTLNPQIIKF